MTTNNIDRIRTTRDNLIKVREQVSAKPKPNYSIDGVSVSWESYLKTLTEQIDALQKQIDTEGDDEGIAFEETQYF